MPKRTQPQTHTHARTHTILNAMRRDIFLKPSEDRSTAGAVFRMFRMTSPLRLRQRTTALVRSFADLFVRLVKREKKERKRAVGDNSPRGMIGSLNWQAEEPAPWQTAENLLEQAEEVDIDFSMKDLIEGRIKKRKPPR